MFEITLLFLIAVLIAIFAASLGIGGGIFTVPVLIYVGSLHGIGQAHLAHMAVATSLLVAFVLSGSASYINLRTGMVETGIGFLFALGSLPGAFIGSLIGRYLPFQSLTLIFGVFVLAMGFYGVHRIFRQKNTESRMPESTSAPSRLWLPLTGFFTGIVASLTGVGGGIVMVPLYSLFLKGKPIHRSIATSNFSMVLVTLAGSLSYLDTRQLLPEPSTGYFYFPMLFPFIAGAVLGGMLGARLGKKVPEKHLKLLLACLQILIGVRMLWKYSGIFE